MPTSKADIISGLQKDILRWQGFKPASSNSNERMGLGPIESAFPFGVFPRGAVHEFLSVQPEHQSACSGFITALLKVLMRHGGGCLWISTSRTLFPPALNAFGIEPDQIIFIDLKREKDVLWVTEEALKCDGIAAVVSEIGEVSLTASRRLQLASEKSGVTGFVVRNDPRKSNTTSCVARWRITSIPCSSESGLPGVGFPRWNIELLKVRNGNPGAWQMEWSADHFLATRAEKISLTPMQNRKVG